MSATAHSRTQRLRIDDLVIETTSDREIVHGVSLEVRGGEILGLVGESGSGKTTTGLAALGYTRRGLRFGRGSVRVEDTEVLSLSAEQQRQQRGSTVSYVPQDPGSALNPALRIDEQMREIFSEHLPNESAEHVTERINTLLHRVQLADAVAVRRKYPHQLSGGQQQRVAIAMAFACDPAVIVLDEPTTGLDVSTQRHLLVMVRELCREGNAAAVYVSHDLAVVKSLADRVAVMFEGQIVERGTVAEVFERPQHDYTKRLLAAVPTGAHGLELSAEVSGSAALEVRNLVANYGDVEVLHDVSLRVGRQECLGIVGESGSGKSTLARCIIGLHGNLAAGQILLEDEALASKVKRRNRSQWQRLQFVFQNPYASLNPRRTIGASLLFAMKQLRPDLLKDGRAKVEQALRDVALSADYFDRYPDQLSGGERQRAAIARALVVEPSVLICDEITSALDVSVQAVVIDTLRRLQTERNFAMIFITHNITLVQEIAHSVLVLSQGTVVEQGATATVLRQPSHPYTRSLLADIVGMHEQPSERNTRD